MNACARCDNVENLKGLEARESFENPKDHDPAVLVPAFPMSTDRRDSFTPLDPSNRSDSPAGFALLAAALLAVTLLMRGPVTSVGPLSEEIVARLAIGYAEYGLLAALPIAVFGLVSFPAPGIGRRFGLKGAAALAVLLLAAGSALRGIALSEALWTGTLFVGAGIGLLNVVMPVVVKTWFAERLGLMMGIYTGVIGLSGSIGGLTAVPVARAFGGYEATMLAWAAAAVAGLLLWLLFARFPASEEGVGAENRGRSQGGNFGGFGTLLRDPLAWSLTAVMGLQSLLIYTVCAWMPAFWRSIGMGAEAGGFWIFVYLVSGLPASIGTARFMKACGNDARAAVILAAFYLFGLCAWYWGETNVLWLAAGSVAAGAAQGSMLSVAFLLMAKKASNLGQMLAMSGLAQGAGYVAAGAGPWIFGALFERSAGFALSFLFTGAVILLWGASGVAADRREKLRGD